MDIWVGSDYEHSASRIMILGESWWGDVEPLSAFVHRWATHWFDDRTFHRMFKAGTGLMSKDASPSERLNWWNSFAFYNFAVGTVGATRDCRPTTAHYQLSREPLRLVLEKLKPRGVWIIGIEQSRYSLEVVQNSGAKYEVVSHPVSYGLRDEVLRESWDALQAKLRSD